MRFTIPRTPRSLPALIGGLIALLTMVMFAAPAKAMVIPPYNDLTPTSNTTVQPYSAVVEITLGTADTGVNKGKSLGACTGWMYASNMVATAGHCLYDPKDVSNGWVPVTGMKVWPGINGDYSDGTPYAPYGSCLVTKSYASTTYVNTYSSYASSGDVRYDYGALRLNCSVGNQTGVLTYDGNGMPPTPGAQTQVIGYPHNGTTYPTDYQYHSPGSVYTYDNNLVYYDNDTETRMSGAPVLQSTSSGWKVVAIHSRDYNTSYNTGPRITSAVVTDLYNWWYYG